MKLKKKSPKSKTTVKKSLATKYKGGGKIKKEKTKVSQKAGFTAEGDKMPELFKSKTLSEVTRNRGADVEDIKVNTKEANAKIESTLKELKALSPDELKGEKGKALKNQLRILRDSKRGVAKRQEGTKMNRKGQIYN